MIVPKPVDFINLKGEPVLIDSYSRISYSKEFGDQAIYLATQILQQLGLQLTVEEFSCRSTTLNLLFDPSISTHDEAYLLSVVDNQISISAASVRGVIYGIQTLLQLCPTRHSQIVKVAPVRIYDYPSFPYRGIHLDVVRHMFSVDYIKKFIDYLTFHKFNTFHWHLTDDQGWRIEVQSYPKLNSVGSWRKETIIGRSEDEPECYDATPYGGFYTRDEVKDIIKYAGIRGVEIIPEIDIPGHSRATIAAYPELSTEPNTKWEVATRWAMFDKKNNVLVPTLHTFNFLETVFGEIADLFPSKYFHLGGDECSKIWWKESLQAQNFISDNELGDELGLQTYFIQFVEKVLHSKGKIAIGWDEIVDGNLDKSTIVMSWRGHQGGIDAAKRKHRVIMSPEHPLYFNCYQSIDTSSLAMNGYNPLDAVYNYNPIPHELLSANLDTYVLGAQGNIWTEYISSEQDLEKMIFPRMTALSEVLWTNCEQKDFPDFKQRLIQYVIPRYEYWKSCYFDDFDQ